MTADEKNSVSIVLLARTIRARVADHPLAPLLGEPWRQRVDMEP